MRAALAALPIAAAVLAMPAGAQQPVAAPDIFVQVEKGNCIACHQVPEGAGPRTRADLGPALDGARMRALGRAKIRALIDDPTRDNPDTLMPPFGRHRILDAAEIQRLVEYLLALP
jgi:L-cysteine S-thiosulfotransferase